MRLRLTVALTLIAAVVCLSIVFQNRTTAKVSVSPNNNPVQVKRKPLQPDLPGTVSGATNPELIPDTVAYELLMRSIADYPSENVFRDAGLQGDQITNALYNVQSFESAMSLFDQEARRIKSSRKGTEKLTPLQKKKEEYLERGMNHFLPMILGADGGSKIRSYIRERVKPKTKRVPGVNARKNKPGIDPNVGAHEEV
jgi:hypothetical protein